LGGKNLSAETDMRKVVSISEVQRTTLFVVPFVVLVIVQMLFHTFPSLNFSEPKIDSGQPIKLNPDAEKYDELYEKRKAAEYAVVPGYTYRQIAENLRISVEEIFKENGLDPDTDPDALVGEKKIMVPVTVNL